MEYSAGMVSALLWWSETQQTAALLAEHKTKEEIIQLARRDNIFSVRSEDRRRRIAAVTYKRVQALPPLMREYLVRADFRTAQCIAVLSVMLTERLFKEFCEDVLYEAIRAQTFVITDEAVRAFMQQKINQSPKVARFSDAAIQKLRQTCIKFLYDGGFLDSTTGKRRIVQPLTAPDFDDCCRQCGLTYYYHILTGRNV